MRQHDQLVWSRLGGHLSCKQAELTSQPVQNRRTSCKSVSTSWAHELIYWWWRLSFPRHLFLKASVIGIFCWLRISIRAVWCSASGSVFNNEGKFIGNIRNDGKDATLLATNFEFSQKVFSTLRSKFGIHNFRPNQVSFSGTFSWTFDLPTLMLIFFIFRELLSHLSSYLHQCSN